MINFPHTNVIKIIETTGQKYFLEFLSHVPVQVCKAFLNFGQVFPKSLKWTTRRFQEVLNVFTPWYRRHRFSEECENSCDLLGFEIDSDDNWHDPEQTDRGFEPSFTGYDPSSPRVSEYDQDELIFDNSDSPGPADYD